LYLTVSVSDPLSIILPWRTIHEKIILFRHLYVITSIALSQIGPYFNPVDRRSIRDLLVQLEGLLMQENESSTQRIETAYAPFRNGKAASLKTRLEQQKMEATLENDPEFIQIFLSLSKK
jgi:hypothetical protein